MIGPWKVSNNGGSARPWFVWRERTEEDRQGGPMEVLRDTRGVYRRFGSSTSARKVAGSLNEASRTVTA